MRLLYTICLLGLTSTFLSAQVCSNANSGTLAVMPLPPAGGYAAGTVVNMCFTLTDFTNVSAEWVHGIIPGFGPGWDVSTIVGVSSPASCSGGGTWDFYNTWTSCNTGQVWGPGFAYDSGAGLGCGGTANDGDPGNNFGDATLCPRTYCWDITTAVPPGSGCNAADYVVEVFVYGDAETGSWSITPPCAMDAPVCWPQLTDFSAMVDEPCPGEAFTLTGVADGLPCGQGVTWTGPGGFMSNDLVTTTTVEGTYTLEVGLANCAQYTATVNATYGTFNPTLDPSPMASYCFGDQVTLTVTGGSTFTFFDPFGVPVQSGANNVYTFTATDLTAGFWTVQVNGMSAACVANLITEIIVAPELSTAGTANPDPVCVGQDITFSVTNPDITFFYEWDGGIATGDTYTITAGAVGMFMMTLTATNLAGCSETIMIPYEVLAPPNASIMASPTSICEGDAVTLTATGGGTYLWSPTGDTGPVLVDMPSVTTTYTVRVTGPNGCIVEEMITVDVQPELAAPQVTCQSLTAATLDFDWPQVPGADYYEVFIDGVSQGTVTSGPINLTGLNPLQMVTIIVVPYSNNNPSCPGLSTTLTCQVRDCDPVTINIDPIDPICVTAANQIVQLIAGAPGAGPGSITWSGPGVIGTMNPGQLLPSLLAPGVYTLTATFALFDGSCPQSETIDVEIVEGASAAIDASDTEVCISEMVTISLGDPAVFGANYTWDFDGATIVSGSGTGPYELSFPTAGDYMITLETEINGCTDDGEITIMVTDSLATPDVFCQSVTNSSVTFGWTDVGAGSYTVTVISGPVGVQTGNSYEMTGLSNGDFVSIQVTANSNGICPSTTSAVQECQAIACPNVMISIDNAPATFCDDGNNAPISLTATLTGAVNPSAVNWGGPGVTGSTFDADDAGPGVHTITANVIDEGCPFTNTVEFEVLELVTSDFTIDPNPACVDQTVTVTYTGNADPGLATFNWDFGGAIISNGSGAGPYEISWSSAGTFNVTLSVTENGCTSTETLIPAEVQRPLDAPMVICINAALDSVTFEWADVPGATGYQVTVITGPMGTQVGNTYIVNGLAEGDMVTIEVVALGAGVCGNSAVTTQTCEAISCPGLFINPMLAQNSFCLADGNPPMLLTAIASGGVGGGGVVWTGNGVFQVGDDYFFDHDAAGLGNHVLMVTYTEGDCSVDNTVAVDVFAIPTATIDNGDGINFGVACENEEIILFNIGDTIPGATYDWAFSGATVNPQVDFETYGVSFAAAGLYTISLVITENGCASQLATYDLLVSAPIGSVVPNCGATDLNNITIDWSNNPEATAYEVQVNSVVVDTVTNLFYTLTGLLPADIVTFTVTPLSPDHPCGDGTPATIMCATDPCPDLQVDFSVNPMETCEDSAPIQLMATINNSSGVMASFGWSGNGVTGDMFDPTAVGPGVHTIVLDYAEAGPCVVKDSFEVEVFPLPLADFSFDLAEACIDQVVTVTYDSIVAATATYDWDFGAATVLSGTGAGPYMISYSTAGAFSVSLAVTENNCTGATMTEDITIIAPLAEPVINCVNQGLEEVTFEWTAIPGATGYDVSDITGPAGVLTGTSYTVTGLTPEQVVTITVTALGPAPCGDGMPVEASCEAAACPDITVNVQTPAQSFCEGVPQAPVILTATTSGGDMTGSFVWSGQGVTQVGPDYFFDPNLAGLGDWTLTVDYVETAGCDGTTTLEMSVVALPTPDFTISADPICVGEPVDISYTGNAGPNAVYVWDFDGAMVTDLGNENYTLVWTSAGSPSITLTVTEGGCSDNLSQGLTVVEPLVAPAPTCGVSTLTSVTFEWPAVAGATGYQVVTDISPTEVVTGTSYTVSNLSPGQSVSFTIVANGPAPCGNTETVTISCSALACPDLNIAVAAPQTTFCADGQAGVQVLMASISGGTGSETAVWTGLGVSENAGVYSFDPNGLIPGDYVLTASYNEGGVCPYSEELTMTINAEPIAGFILGSNLICESTTTSLNLGGTVENGATIDWDFDGANVVDNGNNNYSLSWTNPGTYTIGLMVSQNGCTDMFETQLTVERAPLAGSQAVALERCPDDANPSNLFGLLTGADTGGTWSVLPGTPQGSVNAASGQLNPTGLPAGSYTYRYTVPSPVCGDASADVLVTIQPIPLADAGLDQTLTCAMGMVSLNGSNSDGGAGYTYNWTSDDASVIITNPGSQMIDVAQPGVYQIQVTSNIGCTATDEVVVRAETEVPVPQVDLSNLSCFSSNDGVIQISGVTGGRPPYIYQLNGNQMDNSGFYPGLEPGEYELRVTDANGCFSELFLDVTQPDELSVSLSVIGEGTEVEEGETVTVTARISGGNAIDTLIWEPDSLGNAGEGNSLTFLADETRQIRLTVVDELGCTASDNITVIVRKDRPIFVPTGISPNGDNNNDIFLVYGNNDQIEEIESFLIFNRWGENIFENYNFQPNDPAEGWDGSHRGETLNPAVFVYIAVVHFTDGEVITYKGDVTLVR